MLRYIQLLLLLSHIIFSLEHDTIESIILCVEKLLGGKNYRSTSDYSFSLYYGDPATEVFNIYSDYDIKLLEYINTCAKAYDSSLFISSHQHDAIGSSRYSGYNSTQLTSIISEYYPHLIYKVIKGVQLGVVEAEWSYDMKDIAVSDIEYLEAKASKDKLSVREMEAIAEERRQKERNYALVVNPHIKVPSSEYDNQSDDAMKQHFHYHTKDTSTFTVVIMLSDRIKYDGGNILVRKWVSPVLSQGNDAMYDEVDEDASLVQQVYPKKRAYNPHRYSPLTSRIARFVPEIGGMIVIQSNMEHGIEPVSAGTMKSLMMKFATRKPLSNSDASLNSEL